MDAESDSIKKRYPNRGFAQIHTQLIVLIILVIVPVFGLVLCGNFQQRRIETTRAYEGATAIAQLAAAKQDAFVKDAQGLLATLTQFPFLVLATNQPFCHQNLHNLRTLLPDYLDFGLIESDGRPFCSAELTKSPANLADRSYFQRVLKSRKFSMGDFQQSRLTGKPALNFGCPVFDERGKLKRVLFASLKLSLMSEAIRQIQLPPGATVTLLDRAGTVLAQRPAQEQSVGKCLSDSAVVRRILTGKEGAFEMSGADGIPRLYAVSSITDGVAPSLFISVAIPTAVCFADAKQALIRNLIVMGLVAAGILFVGWLYAKRFFLQPINALVSAARAIAEGDLNARTGGIRGAAELAHLGQAFDEMAERLQKRQTDVTKAQEQISRLNEELEERVRERTSQLQEANKELEAFSYSVSHDLRSPLRHIDGFVGLLDAEAGSTISQEARRYLVQIGQSSKQMGRLIDDLLVFSKMGRAQLRRTRVDMQSLVEDAIQTLQPEFQGRNILWKVAKLPQADADSNLLRQVFINLLSNAIKYTRPRGPALIEIGADETAAEIVIFVRDNGVGFDMEYADKLFGVFQRLHLDEEFEGSGIGLANVHRIIVRHNGRTWAEGKVNGGATFFFSLPKEKHYDGSQTHFAG